MRGLSPVAASGGHSSSRCAGLSLSRPLPLQSTGSRRAGSAIVAHGLSRSAACGIFPDQGSNPCPLHWQADSQPLRHQGSPLMTSEPFLLDVLNLNISTAELMVPLSNLLSCVLNIITISQPARLGTKVSSSTLLYTQPAHSIGTQLLLSLPSERLPGSPYPFHAHPILALLTHPARH